MFNRHYRKVKAIFGFTDVILASLAFLIAYETRIRLHFEKQFFLDFPTAALLLVVSILCWIAIGYWFNIYEKLDSAHPRVVLRHTFRQCALGAICLVVAEYIPRLDLRRSFVALSSPFTPGCSCASSVLTPRERLAPCGEASERPISSWWWVRMRTRATWEKHSSNRPTMASG